MNPLQVLQLVVAGLEKLGLPYMIAGSFASTIYGEPRYTQDADVVVGGIEASDIIRVFSAEFYADRGQVDGAIRRQGSFNLIHVESSFKVDLFVVGAGHYEQEAFQRRARRLLDAESGFSPFVQTAEDAVLAKLRWYRLGGDISETQWRDVLGILKVQGDALDLAYLQKWAEELRLSDLLEKAFGEAGVDGVA